MPRPRHRVNRLPPPPALRRHSVHSPSSPPRESSLERVRRLSREHQQSERPFDPSRRGTWQGSSRDLVVNARSHRRNPKGPHSAADMIDGVKAIVDTALSSDHGSEDIASGSWIVAWEKGDGDLLAIAVIGATGPSSGGRDAPDESEAIDIAKDYALEMGWISESGMSYQNGPDYVAQVEGRDEDKKERFEGLQQGHFYTIDRSLGYRGVDQDDAGEWWGSDYAAGSDYSGGPVTVANYRALLEMGEEYEKESGVTCYETMSSGHGGYHIFFNVYTTPDEIVETLAGLDDYPAVSDEAVSEVEMEQANEAWESWGAKEFRQGLEKDFGGNADDVTDEALYECFHEAMESSNTYWEPQDGAGMYVDMKRVLKAVDEPPAGFVVEES